MLTGEEARVSPQEIEIAVRSLREARDPDHELVLKDAPRSVAALTPSQINTTRTALRGLAQEAHYVVEMDAIGSRCNTYWLRRAMSTFQGSPSAIVIRAQELREHSDAMEQADLVHQAGASVSLGFRLLQLLAHAAVAVTRSGAQCNWSNKHTFSADLIIGALQPSTFGRVLRHEQKHEQVAKSHYTINEVEGGPRLWFALSDYPGESYLAMVGENPPGASFGDPDVGEN